MCGFVGLFSNKGLSSEALKGRLVPMTARVQHRGPDDLGLWVDADSGIGLGFRRLAILDLSPLGAQPMASSEGRYVIVLNGEIYNYVELAELLRKDGFRFRGGSDTEVALAALERWGVEEAFPRFVGMFAMAIWDKRLRRLTLVRDRLGIKPLYFGTFSGELLFASELKALRFDEAFTANLAPSAVAAYLRHLYVPAPLTIFEGVQKLAPGHFLHINDPSKPCPDPQPYWSLRAVAEAGLADPLASSDEEAIQVLEERLREAVRIRLRSDVPLGVLLSGGVDSSTVAALAQSLLDRPLRTFSIGFDAPEHDESHHARAVATCLGTSHTELRLEGPQVLEAVPRIASIYDEPFADPSSLPTLLVSELSRREVTVALSGDGGDEILAGYNRYSMGQKLIPRLERIPLSFRTAAGKVISRVGPGAWDALLSPAVRLMSSASPLRLAGEKAVKLGRMMQGTTPWDMYQALLSVGWSPPSGLLLHPAAEPGLFEEAFSSGVRGSLLDRMMLSDQLTYLPDDLLAKVDRASMAVALEVRVPLLDHRVVELAWRLPHTLKIRGRVMKWALQQILHRHVPRALVDRPKTGFTPPLAGWLRGPLREWGGSLLSADRIRAQGIFDHRAVERKWDSFQRGRTDTALGVWALIQFQAWAEHYL